MRPHIAASQQYLRAIVARCQRGGHLQDSCSLHAAWQEPSLKNRRRQLSREAANPKAAAAKALNLCCKEKSVRMSRNPKRRRAETAP